MAFVLSPGCSVRNLNLVEEGFRIGSVEDDEKIVLSVSFPNLERTFTSLAAIIREPVYFLLEVPCTQNEEKTLDPDTFPHDFVYYFDAVTIKRALDVYYKHSDVLLNDGLVNFGIASKNPRDEVYVGKYKAIWVFSHATGKYVSELEELGFAEKRLITAWDTITEQNPGQCRAFKQGGRNISAVVASLKEEGLFKAEIRGQKGMRQRVRRE